jgi:hypothetical protein
MRANGLERACLFPTLAQAACEEHSEHVLYPLVNKLPTGLLRTVNRSRGGFSSVLLIDSHVSCRVGAGRPLLGRPYPPLTNRAGDFSPHTALTFPWILRYSGSGQHQHTPLFLSLSSQVPRAGLPPKQSWFCRRLLGLSFCRSRWCGLHKPGPPYVE